MRLPPAVGPPLLLLAFLMATAVRAEVCPVETPTEPPSPDSTAASESAAAAPIRRLLLKPKSCPDFKDDADQRHCCPSRITFGSYYCCTQQQKIEIESEIAAERRRQFVKKYLAVIIMVAIGLCVLSIVVASMICKRVRFCPLHHSKGCEFPFGHQGDCVDSRSSTSFQMPSSHSAARCYQPVVQHSAIPRHSATFGSLSAVTPPLNNKPSLPYEAPPSYESAIASSGSVVVSNNDVECSWDNEINAHYDRRAVGTAEVFQTVPPPAPHFAAHFDSS